MKSSYKTLYLFLFLVALWGMFFSSLKYFIWGSLNGTLAPSLEEISGYLSFWGIFAYLVGASFAKVFLKKYYLISLSLLTFIAILIAYIFGFNTNLWLAFTLICLWFFYGLWSVVKNVLVALEIEKTGYKDTTVNAFSEIIFIVCLIAGTIGGNALFEKLENQGYLVILLLLWITAVLSMWLNYETKTFGDLLKNGWKKYMGWRKYEIVISLKEALPEFKKVFHKYGSFMFISALLWTLSTLVSQVSVSLSMKEFAISPTSASTLFLFSALGAILWNGLSIKMHSKRWIYWIVCVTFFSLLLISYGVFLQSFKMMALLATLLGFFFGASANLLDGYFIKRISEDNVKEYGSSSNGLMLSAMLFIGMFFAHFLSLYLGQVLTIALLWALMWISSIILYLRVR